MTKKEFVEKANQDYYWDFTEGATEYIYSLYKDTQTTSLSAILNQFMFVAEELTLEEIHYRAKMKYDTLQELFEDLNNNKMIKLDTGEYEVFGPFIYPCASVGYILKEY